MKIMVDQGFNERFVEIDSGLEMMANAKVRLLRIFCATCISIVLFLIMAFLIAPEERVSVNAGEDVTITIGREKKDESSPDKARKKLVKPVKQKMPPPPSIMNTRPQMRLMGGESFAFLTEFSNEQDVLTGTSDRRASPMVHFPPQYPQGPLSRDVEGWVLVEFTITEAGTVSDVRVVDDHPEGVFRRATLRAIKRWKYQPKIMNGKAVAQYNMRELFRYKIEE